MWLSSARWRTTFTLLFCFLAILGCLSAEPAAGTELPRAVIDLGAVDGSDGIILHGVNSFGDAGRSVSNAGDVNGDGHEDVVIGDSQRFDFLGPGMAWVVFGAPDLPSPVELGALDGTNGFVFQGVTDGDLVGWSVSGAGDVNGDGFDDLLVGAPGAESAGESYLIFGRKTFPATLSSANLNGTNGLILSGDGASDGSGEAVARAGDVNADGFDDFLIEAPAADPNGSASGIVYLVFGATAFAAQIDLADLDGTSGVAIHGAAEGDSIGSPSAAGDVNGDGFSDIVLGGVGVDQSNPEAGAAYLVFGKSSFAPIVELSDLDGSNGVTLFGISSNDLAGISTSGAGDVNGDGLSDIVIGASGHDTSSGEAYVVFGRLSFPASVELADLNGMQGFSMFNNRRFDGAGWDVGGGEDINGDGLSDVIIGSIETDPLDDRPGRGWVVFGRPTFPSRVALAELDGTNGFRMEGGANNDGAGWSVSLIEDLNEDGIGDVFVGAPFGNTPQGLTGEAYVVYGVASFTGAAPELSIGGDCPGTLALDVSGATPGGVVELLVADQEGTFEVSRGWCRGVDLDIQGSLSKVSLSADASGAIQLQPQVGAGLCGRFVQVLDQASCTLSLPVQLP